MSDTTKKKAITPVGIISYPHLDKPGKTDKPTDTPKYSVTLVFTPELLKDPKNAQALKELEEIEGNAAEEKFGKDAREWLRKGKLRSAIRRDAEAKDYPVGSVFVNLRTKDKPGVVSILPVPGTNKPQPIAAEDIRERAYAGALGRASVSAFGYEHSGNKGVSFGLNNVQVVDETTPRIAGRKAAEDEFDADLTAAPASLADLS